MLLLVVANHEAIVKGLIVDTNFQTKIEVGIRLQRDSLKKKKLSAVLIVDTAEYVVAAVTCL